MAEAEVPNEPTNMNQVQQDDGLPLVDPNILKDQRVMLVRDLDVETVLAGLKPFLYYTQVNDINAETNHGVKTGKLIDVIQRLSVKKYDLFNTFMKIVGGSQPDLFCALTGRAPSDTEADFCVQNYAESLKQCIRGQAHSVDSLLDEKIEFDSQHVQLAIVRDRPSTETFENLPHRYQTNLSRIQDGDTVAAADVLADGHAEENFKRISLYGRAGTGKTTTFQWLAREWGFNRWAPQFTVLFLLQMRILSVSNHQMTAIELLTLAGLYQVTEAVRPLSSWLKHAAGRVLILIDGLDEVARFATRLRNCPIISDLNQKADPIDLCLNMLRGDLLPGVTIVSASRPFAGLDTLQFDKKFEVQGLTESRVQDFVERKHPSKAADIMEVLKNSPLLMSVCSITFYCALISRLLAEGVIFENESLQTYTRLMAFLIVQCVERKLSEWSFPIQVGSYFHKLAHMAYVGIFERQLKGEMSMLVFNDRDISQAGLTPQDLKSIQEAGLLHLRKVKVGLRSSVTAEFFHLSAQEMLASAYFLPEFPHSGNMFKQLFCDGQFNMALLYLFGLQFDNESDWIQDIRSSVDPSGGLNSIAEQQMNDFLQSLRDQPGDQNGIISKLQLCQLLYESQVEDKARSAVRYIVPDGKLTIGGTQMTLIDLMAVRFVCKHAEAITEISLVHCALTDTLVESMTSSLLSDHAENILMLTLTGNQICGAGALAEWLKQNHTHHNTSLQTLNVICNDIGESGATALAAALHHNTTLQTLDVGGNTIGDNGATALAAALHHNSTLLTLNVCWSKIGDNGATALAAALHHNSTLLTLGIWESNIGDDGASALAAALHHNSTLQTLDVGGNNIGGDGATDLAAALHHNTSLQTLGFVCNNVGDDGASALAAALHHNRTLQTLDVGGSNIGDDGATALAAALHDNTTLQTLDVEANNIGDNGATALAAALHHNSTLLTLNVCWSKIGDNGATALAAALHHNSTLLTLDVGGNTIGDDGATALAAALHHNTTLHTLNVEGNTIGEKGSSALAAALHHNTTLQSLNVRENTIGEKGASALATALHHNTTLQKLDVRANKIGESGATALATALNHNTTLQTLDVRLSDIGESGVSALAAAQHHALDIRY